jgi:hypothetical protein
MKKVANVAEFVDIALVPAGVVRVAVFDGENADPVNGRLMGDGIKARTPWGEIAYLLAGKEGYLRVRDSDEQRIAPGAETLRELFGGQPTLILLDELSIYLRKVKRLPGASEQIAPFLTSLFTAVEGTSNAALVYTLAIGKDGTSSDAYSEENKVIADRMAELESISARKATLLNPTEEDETAHVLRRRLFDKIDDAAAAVVIGEYKNLWSANAERLPPDALRPETVDAFVSSYPFHPDVLDTLTRKTATLTNFQRVRGMLRLLARTIAQVWKTRPNDATAIHLHHIDPGVELIRQELVTRLGQSAYVPAISGDISASGEGRRALAQELDADHYRGAPPYASYVARTILVHTLAFNEPLKGLSPEHLRFAVIGPSTDISFVDDARKRFVAESAYLDDRPNVPLRFLAEANLTQIIRRQEQQVDAGEVRSQLRDRIKQIFGGPATAVFNLVPFPGGAYDVPDDPSDGRPILALMGHDAVAVGGSVDAVPQLISKIATRKGADNASVRLNRNALVFLVADEARKDEMRTKMVRRLALETLKSPDRLNDLAEHQREIIRQQFAKSDHEVAVAIQQCYRHVFYPSRVDRLSEGVDLAHTAIDTPSASEAPGAGQQAVARVLRDSNKLRTAQDTPDSPSYIRDRTPLKTHGQMTTAALRNEFWRDAGLPILVGDDIFVKAVRNGIDQGVYVYRRGDLLYGEGDPHASITIDEQATLFAMGYATDHGIWPRQSPKAPESGAPPDSGEGRVVGPAPPVPPTHVGPGPGDLTVEGVLKEALAQLWEQARARKWTSVDTVTIRMFEIGDAFRLLGAVGAISGATKTVFISGNYETTDGGSLSLEFKGPVDDAKPLKDFLEPQLRAAREKSLDATFTFTFGEGLTMAGDSADKIAERLTRLASGASYVTASARARR